MARRPLEIGTSGKITTKHHPRKMTGAQWLAYCSFRDVDGKTRQVEKWGETERKAKQRLAQALKDRTSAPSHAKLTKASRFSDAADLWIADIRVRRKTRTIQAYEWVLSCHALPALGDLRLHEFTASRLNGYMAELGARGLSAATRRNIKTVISGVLGEAVAHDVLATNPAKAMRKIEDAPGTIRKRPRALTTAEWRRFLDLLDDSRCAHHLDAPKGRAAACRMCAVARSDVPDLVRFMLGSGVRIGEALALRWSDVRLADDPATATVGPMLVRVPRVGLYRQDDGKSRAAARTILLPRMVVTTLAARRPAAADEFDPVFPSASHGWWDPSSASKQLRKARDRAGFDWVTSHVFRKTAATILDDAGLSARQIADQIGHSRPSLTQDIYLGRGVPNPAAVAALDDAYGSIDDGW